MEYRPLAKSSDLVIKEVEGETIVFDLKRDQTKALNKTSAAIWKLCDGTRSAVEISDLLSEMFDIPVDEHLVWMAFEQLGNEGLLEPDNDLLFMLDERKSFDEETRESTIPELVFNPIGSG